ncbi:hypothetical protein AWE51_15515 [Aquimarina aggregata]|uniref:Uncharacterized protein n=1 Tax=Aquimarina aggregata TaxID=1642818 RepID=A0A163CUT2_9FLAO|nr:hypothetical protein [Aquimarina aggregata]KZS42777.1 hypothetical protein AWE51_15515 [Aquimarina aggregata]
MNKIALKYHLALLLMSFVTWGFFVLVGLPDYYQSWSYEAKVIIVILVTIMYIPLAPFLLKKMFPDREYFKNSLWLALYLTVPLFIYDVIFIGWIGGEGLQFIPIYWYLTFFYFSFWVQFPLIGLLMEKNIEDE